MIETIKKKPIRVADNKPEHHWSPRTQVKEQLQLEKIEYYEYKMYNKQTIDIKDKTIKIQTKQTEKITNH